MALCLGRGRGLAALGDPSADPTSREARRLIERLYKRLVEPKVEAAGIEPVQDFNRLREPVAAS